MVKKYLVLALITIGVLMSGCQGVEATPAKPKIAQDVQVFSGNNSDGAITPQTIEDAFNGVGLLVPGNNNMNRPFSLRFKKVYYKTYNLAMYIEYDITFRLLKKYPKFGALTPLSMSIWDDKEGNINISTLTLNGMARAAEIPVDDPDLVAYAALVHKALNAAIVNGHFKEINYKKTEIQKSYQVNFVAEVDKDEDESYEDYIEDYEAEFEGELEPNGFLFPNFINVQEEIFEKNNYKDIYEFYHTYSLCKFEVIFPVSKLHPEAGAWAPCSFYIYKRKDENVIRMGFLGVDNWITTLDIQEKESLEPLKDAHKTILDILQELSE